MQNSQPAQKSSEGKDIYAGLDQKYAQYRLGHVAMKLEVFTFIDLIGQIDNQDAIDLACGSGYYTRILRDKTNGLVFGADISKDMLSFARSQSSRDSITYIEHDCSLPLEIEQKFDIVTATFLLQHAENYGMLISFLKTIWNLLKPGGRLIGLDQWPYMKAEDFPYYEKYGHYFSLHKESNNHVLEDFDIIQAHFFDKMLGIDMRTKLCHTEPETKARAFNEVGFENFRWVNFAINKDATDEENLFF